MKKTIAGLSLLAAFSGFACAAEEGTYIGANIGQASSDYAGSKNPLTAMLQAGYQANSNFALEAQYGYFGNIAPVGSLNVRGFSLAGVGILPASARFSGFGKLGIASLTSSVSGSGIIGADGTYRKTAMTYGLGGEFNSSPGLAVRFGVDRYSTGGSQGLYILNNGTLTAYYVGFKFRLD